MTLLVFGERDSYGQELDELDTDSDVVVYNGADVIDPPPRRMVGPPLRRLAHIDGDEDELAPLRRLVEASEIGDELLALERVYAEHL